MRLFRPTFNVSGASHSWMRKGAFMQLQKYEEYGVHGNLEASRPTPSARTRCTGRTGRKRVSTSTINFETTTLVPLSSRFWQSPGQPPPDNPPGPAAHSIGRMRARRSKKILRRDRQYPCLSEWDTCGRTVVRFHAGADVAWSAVSNDAASVPSASSFTW